MEDNQDQPTGGRQLTAADANRLAQQLDDEARGVATPGDDLDGGATRVDAPSDDSAASPSPEAATAGYDPLEGEEREAMTGVFPPDVDPSVHLGGSAEEKAALREEYKR